MLGDMNEKPVSTQRNAFDVAMELTDLYSTYHRFGSVKDIQEIFTEFYAIASVCQNCGPDKLVEYVPDKLKELYKQKMEQK